jgi:YidC/Oxa1 family membrane protein insertase
MENNKRILLATALAFLIMLAYPYYTKRYLPQPDRESLYSEPGVSPGSGFTPKGEVKPENDILDDTVMSYDTDYDTVLENEVLNVRINSNSGTVAMATLKEKIDDIILYPLQKQGLGLFMPTVSTVSFDRKSSNDTVNKVDTVLDSENIKRAYKLQGHLLHLVTEGESELRFYMPSEYDMSMRESRYLSVKIKSATGNVEQLKMRNLLKKQLSSKAVDWFALSFRHYSILLDPENIIDLDVRPARDQKGFFFIIRSKTPKIDVLGYLGPNSKQIISNYDENWLDLLNYGKLNNIVKSLLDFFYKIFHNYGLAILFLALLLNVLFAPLTLKSQSSMKKMQGLQPHMQELKEKHKDNPQAVNKEMLELYKKHNVNPMGGCLPMLLQIPIFIALYNTLMRSYELKHASFLWIQDLSVPDRFFMLSRTFPFIGNEFNLLPILMAVLMFVQQKLSPTAKTGGNTAMPNLWFLPIIFGVIFYKFPAGLVLYWFTNSLSMLVLQSINRR